MSPKMTEQARPQPFAFLTGGRGEGDDTLDLPQVPVNEKEKNHREGPEQQGKKRADQRGGAEGDDLCADRRQQRSCIAAWARGLVWAFGMPEIASAVMLLSVIPAWIVPCARRRREAVRASIEIKVPGREPRTRPGIPATILNANAVAGARQADAERASLNAIE